METTKILFFHQVGANGKVYKRNKIYEVPIGLAQGFIKDGHATELEDYLGIECTGGSAIIEDSLNSTSATKALSANQGKILSEEIYDLNCYMRDSANSKGYLSIPVYNSESMQATHPSVLFFSNKWNGYHYWMAMTPYEQGNENLENPSILASDDGVYWVVPSGLTNPIIKTNNVSDYHYSDVHLVYVNNKLECWFRKVTRGSLPTNEIIMRKTSENGILWTDEEVLYETNLSDRNDYTLSPCVIYEENKYKIWVMNRKYKQLDYFESQNGYNWEKVRSIVVPHKNGTPIWHFDIKHTKNGYELYACVGTTYKCYEICYSVSVDNKQFSQFETILTNSKLGFDESRLYRPCFVDTLNRRFLYYGGISASNAWRIGMSFSSLDNPTKFKGLELESNDNVYNTNQYIIEKDVKMRPNSNIRLGNSIICEKFIKLIDKGISAARLAISDKTDTLIIKKDNSEDVGNLEVGVIHQLRTIVNDVLTIIPKTSGKNANLKILTPSKYGVNLFAEKSDTLTIRRDDNTKYGYLEANKFTFKNDLNNTNNELIVTNNRLLFFDGNYHQKVQLAINGVSNERPTDVYIGQMYFDTTIKKPIWFDGAKWIDANGSLV